MQLKHSPVAGIITAVTLLLAASTACAQSRFEEDFDDKDKPWQEVAIQLPPAPVAENLLPFYVSATSTQAFAVDAKSVTVGADGVIRYTLVAKSPQGATNISYEGIRCISFEKKLYAFGRTDGGWSRSRRDQWERISAGDANRQHAALAQDYFCEGKTVAGKAEEMVERIRWKRTLSPQGGN
jgi:hypothetical protein